MILQPDVFFLLPQVEEIKLYPGSMLYSYSTVYTSISGLRFSSNGVTQSYGSNPNPSYYSLSRLCDGNLKNAYIVTSSYTNVVITVSLPRNMFIHHIRIYPVCSTVFCRSWWIRMGKNCVLRLEHGSRLRPRMLLSISDTIFPNTDLPRTANNVLFVSLTLFYSLTHV